MVESTWTSNAQVLTLVSVKLNENTHHTFTCNNLQLKLSTHSIMKTRNPGVAALPVTFSPRNYSYFHKALELLWKSRSCQLCWSQRQKESLTPNLTCY